ncbi:S8 family serine peptidase [Streptomyces sp. Ru62]|uniref:S8 family serine peptidase n=1 Tax=Streptomyces sp. Ru62 TaxID=2080745 RepID=UPI0021561BF7|nr:S8 family serine peptidase [Streptomyces sp. Ru62]
MAKFRLMAAISTGLILLAGVVPTTAMARTATSGTGTRPAAGPGARSTTVRLITGDQVTVTSLPGGRRTASVRPGPGREHIPFETFEEDDKSLTVLPWDAEDLVSAGTLDRRLFDVTSLISQGYDEAHASALPLIVSSDPSREGAARVTAEAARAAAATADRLVALNTPGVPSRNLPSIHARSLRVADRQLGDFWKTLNPGGKAGAARAALTPRVSLDGRVKAVLDRSTAQINAPTAWKAGDEGQGVKVAVLDTGADANHPDLAGRIAKAEDFSGSSNTDDHFGHGTHVASIVGGSGTASGGTRRGVAPRADLLIGKVLGDDGYGTESAVIDGMQWATREHAKVVNMSLGSGSPSDGTDPLSQAVDSLTASSGTLFVVAAGNEGETGPSSVSSPGAADAALTVGAVDRDDSLAPFSSRGPRLGDGAVKPDVTAPGVGIVAARASGTTLGDPVDAHYVALSGTSMATPHVAGAAALLAQQHPDWDAQQLKDALISTAHTVPHTEVTEQGGGRIDLATAMGPVRAGGSVSLAPLRTGGPGGRQRSATVRYTNSGDRPVTLSLSLSLATESGRALPDGVVGLDSDTVRLDPGATAEVPLSTDARHAVRGNYYGYLTAKSADGAVLTHTTVSLAVHAPQHRLTVFYRDRDGKVMPDWLPTIWGPDGFVDYADRQAHVALVEEGTYYVSSAFYDMTDHGGEAGTVVAPEVKVTEDRTVTLNAAEATQVRIRTPRPAEQHGILSTTVYRRIDGHGLIQGAMYFDDVTRLYVSPTSRVTDGAFEFSSRWQMVAPQLRAKVSGSREFVPFYEPDSAVFPDRGARLTAVDAGTSSAPDFRRARGGLAVVRYDFSVTGPELARSAAKAGAKALLMVWPEEQGSAWTRWQPTGDRTAVPSMRASWKDGTALLERVRKGTTTVALSGTVRSPYLYDVVQVSKGFVPKQVVHTVSERESAVVRSTYTRTGASLWASEQRFGWRPYQETAWNQYSRYVPVGRERVEYVTGGDTLWNHVVHHNVVDVPDLPLAAGMRNAPRTYRPGQRATERWFGAPVRPSVPRGWTRPSVRNGDTLSVYVPEFTDSDAGHWSFAEAGGFGTGRATAADDVASAVLYRDGKQTAVSDNGAWGSFEVAPGNARFRLDLTTARVSDDWRLGVRTRTSWTFRSDTTAESAPLPLLQLDYAVPVDAQGAVSRARTHSLGFTVRMQDGVAAPRGVRLKAEASYDGGKTWTTARTARHGDGRQFTATVERPSKVRGDVYVTLRVTATDSAGNGVRQTVERAFLHRGTA